MAIRKFMQAHPRNMSEWANYTDEAIKELAVVKAPSLTPRFDVGGNTKSTARYMVSIYRVGRTHAGQGRV
jgi:hypothetical protein